MDDMTETGAVTQEPQNTPPGWASAVLGDVLVQVGEKVDPTDTHLEKYLGLEHIEKGTGRILMTGKVSDVVSTKAVFRQGDLLYGKLRPYLNKVVAPDFEGVCSTDILVLRPVAEGTSRFWQYRLLAADFVTYASAHVNGVQHPRVDPRTILRFPVLVPPVHEQWRIVEKLDELLSDLDASKSALEKALVKLKRYRQAVLKAAVEGELSREWREANKGKLEPASALLEHILTERRILSRAGRRYKEPTPPYADWMYELPEGWVWASVEQLGYVQLGRQRSPKHRSKDYPTPYIRAANITEKGLDLSDVLHMEFTPQERETYRLLPGDIVVAEASGSPDQVGKPALWRGEIEGCCFQNTVIRLRPVVIDSRYLLTVLKAYYTTGVFMLLAGGVGINHLSAGKFARLPVPIAPVEEQAFIISEVERRLSIADGLEATIQANLKRAERLRRAILKKAFSGELVPQDPDDEPASALLERVKAQRQAAATRKGKTSRKAKPAEQEALL